MFQKAIPTNIITGFLGVGKTTAIRHLLKHKPADENWAVLVNEFGEIGIDGALLDNSAGVAIQEIPGGCMCCVAGVPMQVGLTQLIRKAKPQRLLIEPTGLGHPGDIIKALMCEPFDKILQLETVITLIDPRKLSDSRYCDNPLYLDQAAIADIIVANKIDLASADQLQQFQHWAKPFNADQIECVSRGEIPPRWLNGPHKKHPSIEPNLHLAARQNANTDGAFATLTLPPGESLIKRENRSGDFYSCGWIIAPDRYFNFDQLFILFSGVAATRLKAVMITERGVFAFNSEDGAMNVQELDDCDDSRVELIDRAPIDAEKFEQQMLATIEAEF